MKTFIKIAVILFVSLALQNCGPKDHTNPDVQMVSEEIKDWGIFKIGTWWVYEEETSKFRDSIFVINHSESVLRPNDFPAFQSISFILYSQSNYDSFIINSSGIFRGLSLLNLKKNTKNIQRFVKFCLLLQLNKVYGHAQGQALK